VTSKMGGGQSYWTRPDRKMSRDKLDQTSAQRRVWQKIANAKRRRRDRKANDA